MKNIVSRSKIKTNFIMQRLIEFRVALDKFTLMLLLDFLINHLKDPTQTSQKCVFALLLFFYFIKINQKYFKVRKYLKHFKDETSNV